jgi:hypothetical protein
MTNQVKNELLLRDFGEIIQVYLSCFDILKSQAFRN